MERRRQWCAAGNISLVAGRQAHCFQPFGSLFSILPIYFQTTLTSQQLQPALSVQTVIVRIEINKLYNIFWVFRTSFPLNLSTSLPLLSRKCHRKQENNSHSHSMPAPVFLYLVSVVFTSRLPPTCVSFYRFPATAPRGYGAIICRLVTAHSSADSRRVTSLFIWQIYGNSRIFRYKKEQKHVDFLCLFLFVYLTVTK